MPPTGQPGACLPKSDLPSSCSEMCLDQGKQCAEDCDFGTVLPARAAYYPDMRSCEARSGAVLVETAPCDAVFEAGDFLPWAAATCCCKPSAFVPATVTEREPLCEAACSEDPYPEVPECETYGSCTGNCLEWTRGVERACAECLVGGARFTQSGCNSFECVCGGIELPDLWRACDDECAATRQHEKDLYAAKPRPEPVGRAPAVSVEVPRGFLVSQLLADEPDRLWVVGSSVFGSGRRLSVKVFDASLKVLWEWDDPAGRDVSGAVLSTRLGGETVVMARITGQDAPLLFFDAAGAVREANSHVASPSAISAFGDGLLVKSEVGYDLLLTALDVTGAVRFEVPAVALEGLPSLWSYAVHATPPSFTLAFGVEGALHWRRVAPTGMPLEPAAVLWSRSLTGQAVSVTGAAAAGDDDIVVWGEQWEKRENVTGGFPWVGRLASDGSARFRWSNGALVTPGSVRQAVHTAKGGTCTVGDESWEYSKADIPASGPRCNPDDCDALTVRCFDAGGSEAWKFHLRSESSRGALITVSNSGQLFVSGSVYRDPVRSTGWRYFLYRFDL